MQIPFIHLQNPQSLNVASWASQWWLQSLLLSGALALKIISLLCPLKGKARVKGCIRLRIEMRWRIDERHRGTRRLFQMTEAAERKILVLRKVRLCGKALRWSDSKKLMEAQGGNKRWCRFGDVLLCNYCKMNIQKFPSCLPFSNCLCVGPTHIPNSHTHVVPTHARVIAFYL